MAVTALFNVDRDRLAAERHEAADDHPGPARGRRATARRVEHAHELAQAEDAEPDEADHGDE